ncbi:MAG: DUF853 domain-containing protein [Lachnospiraceae bacterium]|nr:DUF853 domain-containing protein [Lachnospiraceae bacterium]
MYEQGQLWIGQTNEGERVCMNPKLLNRHGLVAGATGTGKTVTLKVMAESFSDMGIPVFLADVKGDLSGCGAAGVDNENMQKRIEKFGLAETSFSYHGYPVTFWDIFGQKGIPLRTTISEMGPILLARLMDLNDTQSDILNIVFKIADDEGLLLIDTKDLKAMLNYVSENNSEYEAQYGKMSPVSIAAIIRALVALEIAGGEQFFAEPALNVTDWFTLSPEGKGMINILDSSSLINNGKLYSTFLLWLMSELFETLPEVGDLDRPKMVFFFDEAHLLFKDAPKALLEKVEQVVKLIRSKGVGIYFCTQNPKDIPNGVLAQLGNKVQHALHAYTPADQKAVKAAAESFRENPDFNTYETIMALGTGEAVVSFMEEGGIPGIAQKAAILPPMSFMGELDAPSRDNIIKGSILYSKYYQSYDPDSAYELLTRKGIEDAKAKELAEQEKAEEKQRLQEEKEAQKQAEREAREAQKEAERQERAEQRAEEMKQRKAEREAELKEKAAARRKTAAAKSVGNSVAGTVGRELGKQAGKNFGKFGKTLGGNVGASLGRGLIGTLFKV